MSRIGVINGYTTHIIETASDLKGFLVGAKCSLLEQDFSRKEQDFTDCYGGLVKIKQGNRQSWKTTVYYLTSSEKNRLTAFNPTSKKAFADRNFVYFKPLNDDNFYRCYFEFYYNEYEDKGYIQLTRLYLVGQEPAITETMPAIPAESERDYSMLDGEDPPCLQEDEVEQGLPWETTTRVSVSYEAQFEDSDSIGGCLIRNYLWNKNENLAFKIKYEFNNIDYANHKEFFDNMDGKIITFAPHSDGNYAYESYVSLVADEWNYRERVNLVVEPLDNNKQDFLKNPIEYIVSCNLWHPAGHTPNGDYVVSCDEWVVVDNPSISHIPDPTNESYAFVTIEGTGVIKYIYAEYGDPAPSRTDIETTGVIYTDSFRVHRDSRYVYAISSDTTHLDSENIWSPPT